MRMRFTWICLLVLILGAVGSAHAATSYGHFIIAQEILKHGSAFFPPELKAIIGDPDCQKAFRGGAVAPDIAESFGHYGQTSDAVEKMLGAAREHLADAQRRHDAVDTQNAREQLAFAYGWLTHYGVDLNVHPLVNSFPDVGDSFTYNTTLEKYKHGMYEVDLDRYLVDKFDKPGSNWEKEFKIPWEFLSEQSGVSEDDLMKTANSNSWKLLGGDITRPVTPLTVTPQWEAVVNDSLRDSLTFIKDPKQFQNWDLCDGRISTEEFDGLRAYEIARNGGKLPDGWGRNYLQIFQTRCAEWAQIEARAGRINCGLPSLPAQGDLKFDTYGKQIDDWLAACVAKLEADKAADPLRAANRDACLALAKSVQDGGNKLYCPGCKTVTAQYWCPNDPDLGDHWMCGCSGVTQLSRLRRPDGKTYNEYASERIAVYDAMAAQLRALADKLKSVEGRTSPTVRKEITQYIATANGQGPVTSSTSTAQGTGTSSGTGTSGQTTTTTQGTGGNGGHGTSSTGQGHSGQTTGGTTGGTSHGTAGTTGGTGQSHGTSTPPPSGTTLSNSKYGYSVQMPGGWKNEPIAAGEEVTQRLRLNGAKATLVEITRVDTGGLSLAQLQQVAAKIMAGNSALATKTQERQLEVPNGTGMDAVYTGSKAGLRIMTVVRFISVANATYVIAGTVPADASQAECMVVSGIIDSFHW